MKQDLQQAVQAIVKAVLGVDVSIELTRPEEKFGDYATNVALQLAKQLQQNPRAIAEQLAGQLREKLADKVKEVTIAGPGFINLTLTDTALAACLGGNNTATQVMAGQTVLVEYSDPNPFKVLHAGHLYTSVVGDAIANLAEAAGGNVHRVNFGGDVGLHVGKTIWSILRDLGGPDLAALAAVPETGRSEWLAACYIAGTQAYDASTEEGGDVQIKLDIQLLNKIVYAVWDSDGGGMGNTYNFPTISDGPIHVAHIQDIYKVCRQWSYDYFDTFYTRLGTKFEKYYPESGVSQLGLETVRLHTPGVFQESDGAIIFRGEQYGLFDQVFITSLGIPAYSAKDVGLIMQKWTDYHFDRSIVITGNEQLQYMRVVLKAIEQFAPELTQASSHLTHGLVKLAGGVKMSSRKGNILRATDVLDVASAANLAATGKDDQQVVLGAVKYAFLKQRLGGDIVYDPEESVSLQGNSGPYLQYALVRANSILAKATIGDATELGAEFEAGERSLIRKLTEYPEVIDKAVAELLPHHICTYLYELAQAFNSFYEHNRVVGDPRQAQRLALVTVYASTLKAGLQLLGMPTPERM